MAEASHENKSGIMPTRETIKRLVNDVKEIIQNPLTDHGIYYTHHDSNMLKGYAMIIGPEDTPYYGGFYFFEFNFPHNYPYSPPVLKFKTGDGMTRFNPNLYRNGKVCVSILNTWRGPGWTSCQTISTVLLTLCTLLNDKPLLNEPGILETHSEFPLYQEIIEYKNISVGVLDFLTRNKQNYPYDFDMFYCFAKQYFLENFDTYLELASKYKTDFEAKYDGQTSIQLKTGMYNMTVRLDYDILLNRLVAVKNSLDAAEK